MKKTTKKSVILAGVCIAFLVSLSCSGGPDLSPTVSSESESMEAPSRARPESSRSVDDGQSPVDLSAGRKIIRDARVELISEDLERDLASIHDRVGALGGYVASSEVALREEDVRQASLAVKVPAENLDRLLDFLREGFQVNRLSTSSSDVTDEYVDVEARLRVLKLQEERLLELLTRRADDLEMIFKIENELARVRGDIESMEGRIRRLDHLVDLSTVSIQAREKRAMDRISGPAVVSFTDQLGGTFKASWGALIKAGKGLAIVMVGAAPWLPLLAAFGYALFRILKWAKVIRPRSIPPPPGQ